MRRTLRCARRLASLLLLAPLLLPAAAAAERLRIVAWNTESGDADPEVVAELIEGLREVDLWGFSEVLPAWADRFQTAAERATGARFGRVLGTTGGADRLLVLYDAERLERISHFELHAINPQRRVRSPLVVQLRDRPSGIEFLFAVNHLYRSRPGLRLQQSRDLRAWAERQVLPVITAGDFNYDWHFENGEADHDAGYDALVAGGVFAWVRPERLVPTQCSRHESVLDFVFAAGAAQRWRPRARILETRADYCPDDALRSDHRPIFASFDLDTARRVALRDESLERIARLEGELARLRRLVEQID